MLQLVTRPRESRIPIDKRQERAIDERGAMGPDRAVVRSTVHVQGTAGFAYLAKRRCLESPVRRVSGVAGLARVVAAPTIMNVNGGYAPDRHASAVCGVVGFEERGGGRDGGRRVEGWVRR